MLHASRRVHFFRDDERFGIKIEGNGSISARSRSRGLHFPLRRLDSADRVHHSLQMLRRRTAASTDNANSVILNEMFVVGRQFFRFQLVDRAPPLVLRKPRVGKNGDVLAGIRAKESNCVVHFNWAGGAVQADDIYIKWLERGQRGTDFSPQQHCACRFKRYLNRNRYPLSGFLHRLKHADHGRFRLQQILRGFNQQHIHAALDQSAGLFEISRDHVVEFDVAERRELGCRSDRAGHKPRSIFRRELLRYFFSNFRGSDVKFRNFVMQIVFGKDHACRAKCVGFDNITANREETRMNVLNNVRPAQRQQLVAAFLAPEIVHTGIAELDVRPHRAVVDNDALKHGLEKVSHQPSALSEIVVDRRSLGTWLPLLICVHPRNPWPEFAFHAQTPALAGPASSVREIY